jgi:hypothetical protein
MKTVKRLEAQQMKFLRSFGGASRRDHLHNKVIREQLEEINIVKDTEKNRLQWRNHLERINDTCLKRAFYYKPRNRRGI